jgi:hypothetical protein
MPELLTYEDLNECGTTDDLPEDNGTISNVYECDYCVEDWYAVYTNLSCNTSDLMPELKTYEDFAECGQTNDLPEDNGTVSSAYACNYCSEDIENLFTAYGDCIMPEELEYRTSYFVDNNYETCCVVTALPSDCHVNNGSYVNTTQSQSCYERYSSQDLKDIVVDGMGTAGASFVKYLDIIILVLVLGFIVGMGAVAVARFRR